MTRVTTTSGRRQLPIDQRPDHIRSFGTRRGHLTESQRLAIEQLGPRYCLPADDNQVLSFAQVFGNTNPVTFEIGCGMGETSVKIAADNPGKNYLGTEVYPAGIGSLLGRIQASGLHNIRVLAFDAVDILRHRIEPASLDAVHILFPDPWPKKRHHKRRLIQPVFADLLASRMKPGAYVHCATDWVPYAEQMLDVLSACAALENAAGSEQWLPRPDWRPVTKFEERGLKRGYVVHDLQFIRRV